MHKVGTPSTDEEPLEEQLERLRYRGRLFTTQCLHCGGRAIGAERVMVATRTADSVWIFTVVFQQRIGERWTTSSPPNVSAPGHKVADRWDFRCKAGKGRAMKEDTILIEMAAAAARNDYRIYF